MSFTLTVFHAFILVLIVTRSQMAASFHDGCWCFKILLTAAVFTASMWISNDFMKGYMEASKLISTAFLIYQAILMLAVSYKINETLVNNYTKDQTNCSKYILILASLLFAGITIYAIIDQFLTFSCGYNKVIMSVTLIAIILMHGLIYFRPR